VSRDRISPKPLFEERKKHNVCSRIVHGETKLSKRADAFVSRKRGTASRAKRPGIVVVTQSPSFF